MEARDPERIVGVIGGMGSAATVDFLAKVVEITDAADDQDHVHFLVDCDPKIPDRTAHLLGAGTDPRPRIVRAAQRLERAGADFLVMPCNTAHAYVADIEEAVAIELVPWLELVAAAVEATGAIKPVLFASVGAVASGIYNRAFESCPIAPRLPADEDQAAITELILEVKRAGAGAPALLRQLHALVESAAADGADLIILGNTELSAINSQSQPFVDRRVVDPAYVVARHVVELAGGKTRSPT